MKSSNDILEELRGNWAQKDLRGWVAVWKILVGWRRVTNDTATIRASLQWERHDFLMHLACWLVNLHSYSSKLGETGLRGWYVGRVMERSWKRSIIRTLLVALNKLWWENEEVTEQGLLGIRRGTGITAMVLADWSSAVWFFFFFFFFYRCLSTKEAQAFDRHSHQNSPSSTILCCRRIFSSLLMKFHSSDLQRSKQVRLWFAIQFPWKFLLFTVSLIEWKVSRLATFIEFFFVSFAAICSIATILSTCPNKKAVALLVSAFSSDFLLAALENLLNCVNFI